MGTTSIIYLVIAFFAGVIIANIFKGGKKSDDKSQTAAKSANNDSEAKAKYEALLKEANTKCQELEKQLKDALNEKIDESVKTSLAEADKLKKKIKDLEDELEEAEDDLDNAKKKLKNKDNEFADLQDNFIKEQKKCTELQGELSNVKDQLNDKIEELNLKVASLNFIQEILSAKEISTADTNKLNKNIDFFESFVKGQFTDINSYLYTTYNLPWNNIEGKAGFENKKKYFHDAFEQWASTKRKSWLDGKTTIAFVGEFSAGKTSIVNRILSQDNPSIPQLPVSTKATTAIPTYIAGGIAVSYSFISGDGKRKAILEDTFKKVSKDILDQVKGVSSLIKYFVITYKNPNLNGLSILDTPGFNSNDSEDRERTIDVINECDALFWVFDVNAGTINRSSISVIKEKLNKPLYVVINKVDTKADSEVLKVENLIKKTLADAGLHVQKFIRFSSKAPLANIMTPIKAVNKIATRDTFVSDVRNDLEQLLRDFDSKVKDANKRHNDAVQEKYSISNDFANCMNALQNDCETARNLPKWVKYYFRKDKFEMTEDEGNRLKQLLDNIAVDRILALNTKFKEGVANAEDIQQTWSDLCNLKEAWGKINDCFEQYKKVSKDIA
ncbi:MAG: dynamin family protein [Bacteroidaceae bacterium]|nr:dynamin family protein [Bacteroidaceae bacterium]